MDTSAEKSAQERNRRVLTLMGALIVFLTFVVKDTRREQLKDSVDTISNAQSLFDARKEARILGTRIESANNGVIAVEEVLLAGNGPHGKLADVILHQRIAGVEQLADEAALLLHMIEQLARAVPGGITKEQKEKLDAMGSRQREFLRKVEAWTARTSAGSDSEPPNLSEVRSEGSSLHNDLYAMGGALYLTLIEQRETQEKAYEHWTWISYGLYMVGWGMTLLGRLYKIEALEIGS